MDFFIGFVVGLVVCGIAAKSYVMKVVADEKAKLSTQFESLKATVDARVSAVRQSVAQKVAGK